MGNSGVQILALLLTMVTFVMILIACILPFWRRNDLEGEVIETIRRSSGLWTKCTYLATGNWNCDAYDRFFIGLPRALQAARGLTIVSLFLGFCASVTSVVGLDCTTIGMDQPGLKQKCMLAAGTMQVLAGICIGVAVSWFASSVLYEFHNPLGRGPYVGQGSRGSYSQSYYGGNGDRYVYGECLFFGWAAMVLGIASGAVFCCNGYSSLNEDDDNRSFNAAYQPPMAGGLDYGRPKSMGHEYI